MTQRCLVAALMTIVCLHGEARADTVHVTLTGPCRAAEMAQRVEEELRLIGFAPGEASAAVAELDIRHDCKDGYRIVIFDRQRGTVVNEAMGHAPTEDVVLRAVELLRAVKNQQEEVADDPECEPEVTIELAPQKAAVDRELTEWESDQGASWRSTPIVSAAAFAAGAGNAASPGASASPAATRTASGRSAAATRAAVA